MAGRVDLRLEGGPIRWSDVVTPASGGPSELMADGDRWVMLPAQALAFAAIRDGVTNGTLRVHYHGPS